MDASSLSQQRAAQNQALFREINERVKTLNQTLVNVIPRAEWICECADDGCFETLEMTADEYEALRRHPSRFAVAPSDEHVYPQVENVVGKNDRYWVVEKIEEAAAVAADLDPRSV